LPLPAALNELKVGPTSAQAKEHETVDLDPGGCRVLRAWYGVAPFEGQGADVTMKVQHIVAGGVSKFKVDNAIFGDPAHGAPLGFEPKSALEECC
jgi:hypothetical protein